MVSIGYGYHSYIISHIWSYECVGSQDHLQLVDPSLWVYGMAVECIPPPQFYPPHFAHRCDQLLEHYFHMNRNRITPQTWEQVYLFLTHNV